MGSCVSTEPAATTGAPPQHSSHHQAHTNTVALASSAIQSGVASGTPAAAGGIMEPQKQAPMSVPQTHTFVAPAVSIGVSGEAPSNADSANYAPNSTQKAPVLINRVALSDEQVQQFAAEGMYLQPGAKYWYDPRSGLWGIEGMGGMGVTMPGNMAFGNVPEDASGRGGSNVFINGRELHPTDVQFLVSRGVPVMPGRYWMNYDSTYGYEHMPYTPIGKVTAGKGGGGGDNFWHSSATGASGNSDSSGAGYISFSDGSSVSYGM